MKKIDELFEQVFNESGLPDRTTPADSFIEPGTDILDFDKERNERIKKEVVKRLKQEAFPDNWMVGRKGNNHTATKTAPRTYDDEDANFIVRNSGQPDLEKDLDEHHEDYPDEILQMSVGDFLTKSKEKDEELYHSIEDIIDKYIGSESVNEESLKQIKKGDSIILKRGNKIYATISQNPNKEFNWMVYFKTGGALSGYKTKEDAIKRAQKMADSWSNTLKGESKLNEDNGDFVGRHGKTDIQLRRGYKHLTGDQLEKLYNELGKLIAKKKLPVKRATLQFESNLDESAMGNIHTMASEASTFKEFIKDVFKEYKDLDKTKAAIAWLKDIYDNN